MGLTVVGEPAPPRPPSSAGVDLYWIPLGAGAHVVRLSGRAYEALVAARERRERRDLYHSALVATTSDGRFVIEMTPVPDGEGARRRGTVAGGAVGSRWLGGLRIFRYEVHRWRDGVIPDIDLAVASPVRLTDDRRRTRRLLDAVAEVPTPVWGRDELHTGEMWNCNSITAWLLARTGLIDAAGTAPEGGRAPGWDAGVAVARTASAPRATTTGTTA